MAEIGRVIAGLEQPRYELVHFNDKAVEAAVKAFHKDQRIESIWKRRAIRAAISAYVEAVKKAAALKARLKAQ